LPRYQADPRARFRCCTSKPRPPATGTIAGTGTAAATPSAFSNNTGGALIPLDTLATVHTDRRPRRLSIILVNSRQVTISFNLKPGAALGEVVEKIQTMAQKRIAGYHQHDLSGRGQGFRELAGKFVGAANRRDRSGVHRTGNTV